MKKTVETPEGIIEIRDPEINVEKIMADIRKNSAEHEKNDPIAHHRVLAEDRMGMRAAIDQVRYRIGKYGEATSLKRGVARRAEILVKQAVRKFMQRHIDQQHDVNQSVLDLLVKLVPYLDQQAKNQIELLEKVQKLEKKIEEKSRS